MAIVKRRNMYLMQYILYIPLPTNKVMLDKYIRPILVNLIIQPGWQTTWWWHEFPDTIFILTDSRFWRRKKIILSTPYFWEGIAVFSSIYKEVWDKWSDEPGSFHLIRRKFNWRSVKCCAECRRRGESFSPACRQSCFPYVSILKISDHFVAHFWCYLEGDISRILLNFRP